MTSIAVAAVRATLCASALVAAPAGAADFIFGDEFESVLVCPAGPQPAIVAAVSPASQQTTLGTQKNYLIHVLSCGFAGSVTLTPSGVPASWTVAVDPPNLNLASGAPGAAEMSVVVPTDCAGVDTGLHTISVAAAASGANSVPLSADLDVANEFLIHFAPDGTGAGTHAFYPTSLTVAVGAKLRYIDDDSTVAHRIHGEGGIPHQAFDMTQGQEFDVTTTTPFSNALVYCHDHNYNLSVPGTYMKVTVVP